ncbi:MULTISPECIES: alpha-hydroxy-acid oxidizing protein [Faecalicoccus]|uniref:L-lactate oxidase n=3 Tax=Faecalicoccus TaxID=1573536 RepID=A0AAW6CU04_9FIRM|nr:MULTISPECIES: alpha-hydroxy-acid oxidizing protein [Faecalicoccus]MDB7981100.1 alpha-hydroxy-acid oxidizing protein [Faecalicoccus pleomorphus]MDB7983353.1 alpha-hydroxy-acid oxidizing protein [Faecalicoccus pleomorphus]MDY4869536.1 alpha-hydroxy-acid oxidizing protein [Faecalicoccus sp.]
MKVEQILQKSRENMNDLCKSCPVCNGRACRNTIPGPGAKGSGTVAIRNYDAWKNIHLVMDTICENTPVSTQTNLFGHTFRLPVFAGPVGAVSMHYGDAYVDQTYNKVLVKACKDAGIMAFTGDGMDDQIMIGATQNIKENDGIGVPTIKPWAKEMVVEKLKLAKEAGALAIAMDIDAAGLPFLKGFVPPAGRKNVEELKEIVQEIDVPFIAKGILSVKGALKAKEAGASCIVVSNHGGRVLDDTPATADVLEEIVQAVGKDMTILVDGGIRSGQDIFKALALGADGVLVARPFVNMIYGAQEEGVKSLVDQLEQELIDTMEMCGASTIQEITRDMIR